MSRAAIIKLLKNTVDVPVFGTNAIDSPKSSQFVIARFEEKEQAFADIGTRKLTVWFHDRQKTYDVIDSMLGLVKGAMVNAVHVPGSDGFTLTQVDWRGDSADLYDDGFRTVTRFSSYEYQSHATS